MVNQKELQEAYLNRVAKTVIEAETKVKQLSQELRVAEAVLSAARKELKELEKRV